MQYILGPIKDDKMMTTIIDIQLGFKTWEMCTVVY